MSTKVLEVSFEGPANIQTLCGPRDENLRRVEKELGVELSARGDTVRIRGEESSVDLAYRLLEELYQPALIGYVEPSITGLRQDLNDYLNHYNWQRPHHGRWNKAILRV